MTAISIAMATYNGERYLREQLDSLARQKHLPDELVVCDDGSTDNTLRIIKDFANEAPFPVHLHKNERNLGYANNFFKAALLCKGDWIAFCDQDDVWLPNKLSDCAAALERNPAFTMILQNAELCDAELRPKGSLYPNKLRPGIYGANRQEAFWVWAGFVMTCNAALFREFDVLERPMAPSGPLSSFSHDGWSCMVANALGGVAVLKKTAALYRRHQSAWSGDLKRRSVSETVAVSYSVGSDFYVARSQAADSAADYLKKAANHVTRAEWRSQLLHASNLYRRFSNIMRTRAEIYRTSKTVDRLRLYAGMIRAGSYGSRSPMSLGWQSAAKDLFVAFCGR